MYSACSAYLTFVRFEVLTAVVIKGFMFWDIKPCFLIHAGFSLGLFYDPEDGSDIFLRNVC
jgi:hypothetical protein